MDIYKQILECETDEDLKILAEEAINYFTDEALDENNCSGLIGSKLEVNPTDYHLTEKDFIGDKYCYCVNVWNGYIPKGMKRVYGLYLYRDTRLSSNKGCYYYVDDDTYVFDFYKFLKTRKITDEFDLILAAYEFTGRYFDGTFNVIDRETIFKTLYKDDKLLHKPAREHYLSMLKNKGGAMCSERALLAENLLSVLGFEMIYMMDRTHTYNFFVFHNGEETEIYIMDFAKYVEVYNQNFDLVGTSPFLRKVENCSNEMLDRVVNNGERIELQGYFLYTINNETYEMVTDEIRTYGIDYGFDEEKKLIL
jgi:hypothetical protein